MMQPHYTLPGVMHYLQTEFTRNERDRIAWELERSEMKARIALLEGENKDLQYQLVKLKSPSYKDKECSLELANEENNVDLTQLMKSKMAVQDNVKEIIYLFKSPNITTQLRSLNDKQESVHDLEKMNLNQPIAQHDMIDSDGVVEAPSSMHQTEALQEVMDDRSLVPPEDTHSDAATVIANTETNNDSCGGVRPRRLSSLFARDKAASQGSMSNEDHTAHVGGNDEARKASSLFKSDSHQIIKMKASHNHVITFSKDGHLSLWYIDNNFNCADSPLKKFEGISLSLLDIYWLDTNKFLILDDEGIKLFTSESEKPVSQLKIFDNKKTRDSKTNQIEFSDIVCHAFKKNAVLLVTERKIHVIEISIQVNGFTPAIIESKRFLIPLQKIPLAAEFGMTEKSLLVLHADPYEVVIYNCQGKVLQTISLSSSLSKTSDNDYKPVLHLDKKSSKMLIEYQKSILVYSFDQKKIVVKYVLNTRPANIVYRPANDKVIISYENGCIEVRKLGDLDTIIETYPTPGESISSNDKIVAIDSTTVNSTTVIVINGTSGGIRTIALTDPNS